MKNYCILLLLPALLLSCNSRLGKESPDIFNHSNDTIGTNIYFLDYHYQEEPEKILWTVGTRRVLYPDGTFSVLHYQVEDTTKPSYVMKFDQFGYPLGQGTDKHFEHIYRDKVELNFRGRDTTIALNTEILIDSSKLWFWKIQPEVHDSLLVRSIRKNFISNSIDVRSTTYKYLGLENLEFDNQTIEAHKILVRTLGQPRNIYDERWLNSEGIMIKERHVVGGDGVRVAIPRGAING